jgi:NAD(P)-dependent dehydrogenase (short-subunit alcohol dehydrogenase family)
VTSVLVAGGASGIGRAAVRGFRARGDAVLVADLDLARAQEVAAEDLPGPAAALGLDLSTPSGPAEAVAAAVEHGGSLDVVFGNAGLLRAAPLAEWTVEDWDRTMALNLRAPFLLAQAAAPHLRRSPLARLIFTSSTGALRGHAGMPAYHASKAGLNNLVRALADELSPDGIRVNTVCPGWVDTPFNDAFWQHQDDPAAALDALTSSIPLRRQAVPEDIVGLVLFLASPASDYITGQSLVIDGGYTAV